MAGRAGRAAVAGRTRVLRDPVHRLELLVRLLPHHPELLRQHRLELRRQLRESDINISQ